MKKLIALTLLTACVALADYVAPPQKLARTPSYERTQEIISRAPSSAMVQIPAQYARITAAERAVATNHIATAAVGFLPAIIADTRANIPEVAELTDIEIAELYIAQMQKPAEELQALAPTNSIEYLIGAGIRQDILKRKE